MDVSKRRLPRRQYWTQRLHTVVSLRRHAVPSIYRKHGAPELRTSKSPSEAPAGGFEQQMGTEEGRGEPAGLEPAASCTSRKQFASLARFDFQRIFPVLTS